MGLYDRSKEINRLDHGDVIRHFVDRSIVRRLYTDDQIVIMEFWQLTQNLGKGLRTNLGGSPRRLRHLCQFYFLDHLVSSSPFAYTYRKNL